MPDMCTVNCATDRVAQNLKTWPNLTPQKLAWVIADMVAHPRDHGAWTGPNWDVQTLTVEVCQRIWNTPCHPAAIPAGYRGLPFKTLRQLCYYWQWDAAKFCHIEMELAEAREWLMACACNRRCGGRDWQAWLDDPQRWLLRHVSDAAYARVKSWQTEGEAA